MLIFTIGEILVIPSEYVLVDNIAPARNRGSCFGAHSISAVGSFIGPTLGGLILGMLGGPAMFVLSAGFAAAGSLLFVRGSRIRAPVL
ncbi:MULTISPECIES: hypothetical protein [unclassified Rhizobium]|uniref:hypothetical protein n=1 Tax=unclassified Rhizobium TaxID=2613769 RepID=UPI0006FF2FA4|nr:MULTISPECIES: hypothetical protein [unclassified Rhizobium]KQV33035.1 hypothetical protein ASC86_17845 [Rhizobium sp. Root1212]KRD27592.1 hypothetical protein ASE37_24570 [Rhizobium sp. Root268]